MPLTEESNQFLDGCSTDVRFLGCRRIAPFSTVVAWNEQEPGLNHPDETSHGSLVRSVIAEQIYSLQRPQGKLVTKRKIGNLAVIEPNDAEQKSARLLRQHVFDRKRELSTAFRVIERVL